MFEPAPPTDLSGKTELCAGMTMRMLEAFNLWCMGHIGGLAIDRIVFPQMTDPKTGKTVVWERPDMADRAMQFGMESMNKKISEIMAKREKEDSSDDDGTPTVH